MRRSASLIVCVTFVLLVQLQAYAPRAISYPPTDNYGSDCTATAFFTCHGTTNAAPTITDNQAGDDVWRSTNSGLYDVDFSDDAGLTSFATTVWTGTAQSGTNLQAWTQVSTLSGTSYTTNWALLSSTWTAMQQGTNYVSVRVTDSASATTTRVDTFYVRKDTTAPGNPTTINDGTGTDLQWTASTTSLSANWTAGSDLHAGVSNYDWCFTTDATNSCGTTGRVAVGTNLAATAVTASGLSLTQGTVYYACLRARDAAGNVATSYACSNGQRPDTGPPTIADNQAGDAAWRSSNVATYDVDMADGWSLARFETRVWTASAQGGTMLQDWTTVSTISGTAHLSNWSLLASTWTALQQGTSYVSVRVFDSAGNSAVLVDAFTVNKDTTAPSNPSTVNDGAGADIDVQASTSTLDANWTAGSDAHSGIAQYQYCFSTSTACGGTVVASGTTTGTSISRTALSLAPWTTYHACVRARDVATNDATSYACSDGVQTQGTLTVSIAGFETIDYGTVSGGSVGYGETRVTVSTDAPGGYTLGIHDPDGNGAAWNGSASLPWNTSGTIALPAAFAGTGMAISAFGGAETPARWCSGGQVNCSSIDDPQLLWAAVGSTTATVASSSAAISNDTTRIPARVELPAAQPVGSYSGGLVITVTAVT